MNKTVVVFSLLIFFIGISNINIIETKKQKNIEKAEALFYKEELFKTIVLSARHITDYELNGKLKGVESFIKDNLKVKSNYERSVKNHNWDMSTAKEGYVSAKIISFTNRKMDKNKYHLLCNNFKETEGLYCEGETIIKKVNAKVF